LFALSSDRPKRLAYCGKNAQSFREKAERKASDFENVRIDGKRDEHKWKSICG
jgi:hypothetical protein